MTAVWASWLVAGLGLYAAVGVIFSIAFVAIGIDRVDPAAHGAPKAFRCLVSPAAAALWPLLLGRWLRGVSHPPDEDNAHRRASRR